jgi:prepilin-type N-terminal cleavage/methylation domain-containing protein
MAGAAHTAEHHLPAKKGSRKMGQNPQTAQGIAPRSEEAADIRRGGNLRRLRSNQGFTLVELMVVVVVIAILASAGGYVATKLIPKSVESIMVGDAQTVKNPLVEHYIDYNQFPSAIAPSTGTASASTMLFDPTEGNVVAIASGSTATEVTVTVTNPKKPGYTCSITVRQQGSAKPICA